MLKVIGVALIAGGVAAFWFGGIPYTTRDTVLQLGSLKAEANVRHRFDIPPEAAAVAVATGTVLLLLPARRKR